MLTATTVRDSFVTDWKFDRLLEIRDTTTCDLSFRGNVAPGGTITIRSYGGGGIQVTPDTSRWNALYRFGIECTAPLEGYQRSVTLSRLPARPLLRAHPRRRALRQVRPRPVRLATVVRRGTCRGRNRCRRALQSLGGEGAVRLRAEFLSFSRRR